MYLISPFVVASMVKRGPYLTPITLMILSIVLNFIIDRAFCTPEKMAELVANEEKYPDIMCGYTRMDLFRQTYF